LFALSVTREDTEFVLHQMTNYGDSARNSQTLAAVAVTVIPFLDLVPAAPASIKFEDVWPHVMSLHVVRLKDMNDIAARLRKEGRLPFLDWGPRKRVSDGHYRMQRP